MSDAAESRTEQASARRQEEARRKGQVPLSRDVSMALSLMAALALLYSASDQAILRVVSMVREWLALAGQPGLWAAGTADSLQALLLKAGADSMMIVLPLMACVVVTATGATFVQTGFAWRSDALQPDLGRLSPLAGVKRLVSWRSLFDLVKSLAKVGFVAVVAYAAARSDWERLAEWPQLGVEGVLGTTGDVLLRLTFWIGLMLLGLAAVDYGYQRFEWQRNLRMSRQEVKEEHREAEGDPQLRARVRSLQREMGRKRMMAAVPMATVVVTNPTHIAVALRYDQGSMGAPVVVAKGAGFIAERIKEVAREHGVMVIERPTVARALYKLVDLGKEIPVDLYKAVAELLAMVYRAKHIRVEAS